MQQIAFALQICQIVFHILSILIPAFASYRPDSPSSKDSKGSKSTKDEKITAAKTGDEAAQKLIDEASKTFQSVEQTWGAGAAGLPKKSAGGGDGEGSGERDGAGGKSTGGGKVGGMGGGNQMKAADCNAVEMVDIHSFI
jgi:hypothetical protein